MAANVDGGEGEMDTRLEENAFEYGGDDMAEAPLAEKSTEEVAPRPRLPWIGALENPRLGPMVVLNESGYLVPLLTAGDLLCGCKYFWHRS
jgi:hypothetical protein